MPNNYIRLFSLYLENSEKSLLIYEDLRNFLEWRKIAGVFFLSKTEVETYKQEGGLKRSI